MDCIQSPALILTSYVTLGQLFNLFILQFSPSGTEGHYCTNLLGCRENSPSNMCREVAKVPTLEGARYSTF